jgi:hypothetical protein
MERQNLYLIFIEVVLLITALYIFQNQKVNKETIRIHSSDAVLPDDNEPLPIVTEPPFHLQPIIEESENGVVSEESIEGWQNSPCPASFNPGFARDTSSLEGFIIGSETLPTAANPFMNVLIPEIKDNPTRPEAAEVDDPTVKQQLDDLFRVNFYNDPTDVFGRNQSQRQFITMPSTSVPNDRESLQNWLYNIVPKNCKSGGRAACLPGTDGDPITIFNQNF